MDSPRRFPPPWRIVSSNSAFWLEDSEGKSFAYCYFVDEVKCADDVHKLNRAEARRIVVALAKLPGLMG